jgi:hypothetical protein
MTINSELNFPQVWDTNFCPEKLYGPLVNVPFPAANIQYSRQKFSKKIENSGGEA